MIADPVGITLGAERALVDALGLEPLPVAADLRRATGVFREARFSLEARAYTGPTVAYARVVTAHGSGLRIGNLLCAPRPRLPAPIFGADLVDVGRGQLLLVADLSPTAGPGPARDLQLASLARRRRAAARPNTNELPAWCRPWFSPWALVGRYGPDEAARVSGELADFLGAFHEVMSGAAVDVDGALARRERWTGYARAHRDQDRGLRLLHKAIGTDWAERFLREVMFPEELPQ